MGGPVRGMLTGKTLSDIDVAVDGDAVGIARGFASEAGGTFVMLDERFGSARAVCGGVNIDISRMRARTIEEDLLMRDLTINAMALPISKLPKDRRLKGNALMAALIDPAGGRADLKAGIIRMVSKDNLADDPLRLLRVYRFSAELGFALDAATARAVRKHARLIAGVKAERVSAELRHMLASPSSHGAVRAMRAAGLINNIFPEFIKTKAGVPPEALRRLESLITLHKSAYSPYDKGLRNMLKADMPKLVSLKLAVLLAPLGPGRAARAARRLRLSNRERKFICLMLENQKKAAALEHGKPTLSAVRLMISLKDDLYPLLLLTSAIKGARPFGRGLLKLYVNDVRPRTERRYLTGGDLKAEFGIQPSPLYKKVLTRIEELTLMGRVGSREDALTAAGKIIRTAGSSS